MGKTRCFFSDFTHSRRPPKLDERTTGPRRGARTQTSKGYSAAECGRAANRANNQIVINRLLPCLSPSARNPTSQHRARRPIADDSAKIEAERNLPPATTPTSSDVRMLTSDGYVQQSCGNSIVIGSFNRSSFTWLFTRYSVLAACIMLAQLLYQILRMSCNSYSLSTLDRASRMLPRAVLRLLLGIWFLGLVFSPHTFSQDHT